MIIVMGQKLRKRSFIKIVVKKYLPAQKRAMLSSGSRSISQKHYVFVVVRKQLKTRRQSTSLRRECSVLFVVFGIFIFRNRYKWLAVYRKTLNGEWRPSTEALKFEICWEIQNSKKFRYLHGWIVMKFSSVPPDNASVPSVCRDTTVSIGPGTHSPDALHSTLTVAIFVPVHPWMFAMPS